MATHSSVLAWRMPGTGEPGGLPSMGSNRVGHDWSDLAAAAAAEGAGPQMGRRKDLSSFESQGEDSEGGLRGPWTQEQSGLWEDIGLMSTCCISWHLGLRETGEPSTGVWLPNIQISDWCPSIESRLTDTQISERLGSWYEGWGVSRGGERKESEVVPGDKVRSLREDWRDLKWRF